MTAVAKRTTVITYGSYPVAADAIPGLGPPSGQGASRGPARLTARRARPGPACACSATVGEAEAVTLDLRGHLRKRPEHRALAAVPRPPRPPQRAPRP